MARTKSEPAIRLRGVRQNNLKNIDLDLPLRRLIVITGLSGSGKSSLAFETLYAEGQRRYIETFSPYARQFFDRMDKPQVDKIEGIPPAIAIEQRNAVRTTRSTVGTMTEICDHMKVLWPSVSQLHCRQCHRIVQRETSSDVWSWAQSLPQPAEVLVTFDLPRSEKLSWADTLDLITKQGYQRLWVQGLIQRIEDLSQQPAHLPFITVIQDRIKILPTSSAKSRFLEAAEQAYHFGKGKITLRWRSSSTSESWSEFHPFSQGYHCASCDLEFKEPSPARFSFNHPLGACPECRGFGRVIGIDYKLAMPDWSKSIAEGVIKPWQSGVSADSQKDLLKVCRAREIPIHVPFSELPEATQKYVIEGEPGYGTNEELEWPRAWYGVKGYFRWLESKAYKMHVRVLLSRYRSYTPCPACKGQRFQPDSLLYKVPSWGLAGSQQSLNLSDFYQLSVDRALEWVHRWIEHRPPRRDDPVTLVLNEVSARLAYLSEVGLGYLTLDRPTRTLSGGETERVNLTTCLGTRLVNTLFVLDEPSVGLHARDTHRLIRILERLRDQGNTVVVVEHESSVMRAADLIIDLGPGQGEKGGHIVFQGSGSEILKSRDSLTGQYLSGRKQMELPPRRPVSTEETGWLTLSGASLHNLQDVTLSVPLGRLVCISGVSGSGKTTLVREVLLPALNQRIGNTSGGSSASNASEDQEGSDDLSESDSDSGKAVRIDGWQSLGEVVLVDQSPLGRTPRSNPVVYIGAFEHLRELFAETELARQRGINASGFSFNSGQGQCERCRGAGFEKIEMQFLSDVFIRCPDCKGRRYREHILEIKLTSPAPAPAPSRRGRTLTQDTGYPLPAAESEMALELNEHAAVVFPSSRSASTSASPSGQPPPRSWSIGDMLEATVDESIAFLKGLPGRRHAERALKGLQLLQDVGLGYLRLGQPINTLSGGECQRLKLVSHVAASRSQLQPTEARNRLGTAAGTQPTLFLLDEPTTGLHFEDVRILLQVFQRLVNAGHSVLVIEHNLDVIRSADWVIDLGPDAGEAGGRIVVEGTPETVAACASSHTGQALAAVPHSPSFPSASRNPKRESSSCR